MKKYVLAYKEFITNELLKNHTKEELQILARYHVNQIKFIQHERLIHLIITIITAIGFIISGYILIVSTSILVKCFFIVMTILLICYIKHYCFLENEVQSLYKYYEDIYRKITNK